MAITSGQHSWSVPIHLDDIPEEGRHYALQADEAVRQAVAKQAGLLAVPKLGAEFDVSRHGGGLRVIGHVSAEVEQTCVVSLEPVHNQVNEAIDLLFTPDGSAAALEGIEADEEMDGPEPLIGDTVDLGGLATEFLLLGIDPYPRKPGAVFESPSTGDEGDHPFAALAALKTSRNERPN